MQPLIATRVFQANETDAVQLIEFGEPIIVCGVMVSATGVGFPHLTSFEDADGDAVLLFSMATLLKTYTYDVTWLASNGLALSIGAQDPIFAKITVHYRPTG